MKRLACIALCVMMLGLLPQAALANNIYLFYDSNTRLLTEEELFQWQYEALGYAYNELFARHGFTFDPGGPNEKWFSQQSWYQANTALTSQQVYDRLSPLEWANVNLIKDVRQKMRERGDKNPGGKTLPGLEANLYNIPDQFEEYRFSPEQSFVVYSGPGAHYLRGAKGRASVSTNGTVYVAGWDGKWLLVLYSTNAGNARMGYVEGGQIRDVIQAPQLSFAHRPARIVRACDLTDDPTGSHAPLAQLRAGDSVSYLFEITNRSEWAYVEAQTAQGPVRGCIPPDALE